MNIGSKVATYLIGVNIQYDSYNGGYNWLADKFSKGDIVSMF